MRRFLAAAALAIALPLIGSASCSVRMPGPHFKGKLPRVDSGTEDRLRRDIEVLADAIGERNVQRRPTALNAAVGHVQQAFRDAGYDAHRQLVPTPSGDTHNVIARLPGTSDEVFVVGAHIDTAAGTPGADDNGSGVAAMLELARRFSGQEPPLTLEFVAWTNEEPPWFKSPYMGSVAHAKDLNERGVPVRMVWSLETMGYYRDEKRSQHYPFPFSLAYPSEGNFLGFVGNNASGAAVRNTVRVFRETQTLPAQGAALPGSIPGVDWSDHASYWPYDIDAIMITDTAPFRNPHYHEPTDTLGELDLERLGRAVQGLEATLRVLMDE